jgi:hypothetical protein
LGFGVSTVARGKVIGLAPEYVEVTCELVPGNSGGPIINEDARVVAVTTFLLRPETDSNWTNRNTRFAQARRFGLRVTSDPIWTEVDEATYVRSGMAIRDLETLRSQGFELLRHMLREPTTETPKDLVSEPVLQQIANEHARFAARIDRQSSRSFRSMSHLDKVNARLSESFRDVVQRVPTSMLRLIEESQAKHQASLTPFQKRRMEGLLESARALDEGLRRALTGDFGFFEPRPTF